MIKFRCEVCGRSYKVKGEHAGRRTKCRECGSPLLVPDLQMQDEDWDQPVDQWDEPASGPHDDDSWGEDEALPARRSKRKKPQKKQPQEQQARPRPNKGLNKGKLWGFIATGVIGVALIGALVVWMTGATISHAEKVRARLIEVTLKGLREKDPNATPAQAEESVTKLLARVKHVTPWSVLLPPDQRGLVSLEGQLKWEDVKTFYSDTTAPLDERARHVLKVADDLDTNLATFVRDTVEAAAAGESASVIDFEIAEQLFLTKLINDLA